MSIEMNEEQKVHCEILLGKKKIISVKPIGTGQGMLNSNFKIECEDKKKFLFRKFSNLVMNNNNVNKEYFIMRYIKSALPKELICPKVIAIDDSKNIFKDCNVLLGEFIEGETCGVKHMKDVTVIKAMARLLKQIHSIKLNKNDLPKEFSIDKVHKMLKRKEEEEMRLYPNEKIINTFLGLKNDSIDQEINWVMKGAQLNYFTKIEFEAYNKSLKITSNIIKSKEFIEISKDTLCHGDSRIGNVMKNNATNSYVYIDWEGARIGCFLEDLAIPIVSAFWSGTDLEKVFLMEYFGKDKYEESMKKYGKLLNFYKVRALGRIVSFFILAVQKKYKGKKEEPISKENFAIVYGLKYYIDHFKDNILNLDL